MQQLLRSIPFLFVRHTQCIMGQWRLYVSLAWHISMCTSCLCLRRSSKVWFRIKIIVELLELLLVLTTSREQPCCWLCILYLFCYSAIKQVSAYSSNNCKDSLLSTNIVTCIFDGILILVTVRAQDSLRTRICGGKKTTQGGLIARKQFLAKRYL